MILGFDGVLGTGRSGRRTMLPSAPWFSGRFAGTDLVYGNCRNWAKVITAKIPCFIEPQSL